MTTRLAFSAVERMEYPRLSTLTAQHESSERARAFTVGAICKALGGGSTGDTLAALEARLGQDAPYATMLRKTAVAPIGTTVGEMAPFGGAFLRLVASRSAFEGLSLPKVPSFTRIALANGGDLAVTWVDEAEAIPIGRVPLDFARYSSC
jgi:hypothetical protein